MRAWQFVSTRNPLWRAAGTLLMLLVVGVTGLYVARGPRPLQPSSDPSIMAGAGAQGRFGTVTEPLGKGLFVLTYDTITGQQEDLHLQKVAGRLDEPQTTWNMDSPAARKQGGQCSDKRKHLCELASRGLVDWCVLNHVGKLRLEKLTGIRGRLTEEYDPGWNRRVNTWPWYYLQQRIEQKCAEAGIEVEFVQAAGTSQTCSNCGHRDAASRNGVAFVCTRCGYQCHADLNAANNIARVGDVVDFETSNPSRAAVRLDRPKARPMVGQPVLTDLGQTTPQPSCAAVDAVWVPRERDA